MPNIPISFNWVLFLENIILYNLMQSFILNQPTLGKTIYDRFKLNRWKGDGSAPTRQQVILIPKFNFVELFFLDLAKLTRSIVTHCVENCNVDKNLKINWLREQKAINL